MLNLAGVHCCILTDITLKVRPDYAKCQLNIDWHKIGQISPTASNREIIARTICDTPDATRLLEKPITIEILNDWCLCKDNSVRIAKCFLSGKSEPDDPLLREKEDEIIDSFTYEHIWLETALYETLWRLINTKGDKILKIFKQRWKDASFQSKVELMQELIREDLSEQFYARVHSKFYQYNPKLDKELQILNSQPIFSDADNRRRENLINRLYPHTKHSLWNQRLRSVLDALVEKGDVFVHTHLKIIGEIKRGLAKLDLKTHCDPSLKHHKLPLHSWQDGHIKSDRLIVEPIRLLSDDEHYEDSVQEN